MANDTSHIYQSLVSNLAIAVAKAAAAVFTGSGAMLAEAIHSFSDCANQILLLIGVRGAARPPDAQHPFGYGRTVYFWSFMVALLLFTGGGVFSVYEGLHKWSHPEPMSYVGIGIGILLFSLAVEGWATLSNLREMKKRRGTTPLFRYLRQTKDSDLVVVFGENSAATLGLILATAAMSAAAITGDPRYDALGSLSIGLVLIGVAIFLAVEVKSLLVGESADQHITETVNALAAESHGVRRVLQALTIQQGPGEVIVALKVDVDPDLDVPGLYRALTAFEEAIRARLPEVRWCFIEPGDTVRGDGVRGGRAAD